jgi:hypothetical protein
MRAIYTRKTAAADLAPAALRGAART